MTIEVLRPRMMASSLCVIVCCLLSACIFSSREVADAPDSDATSDVSDTTTNDVDDAANDGEADDAVDTIDGTSDVSDTSETGDTDEDTDLQCSDPLMPCEGDCVDFGTDPEHCGGCDRPCPELDNAVAGCDASECVYTCEEDFSDLNGDLGEEDSDGCEGEVNCSAEELRTYYLDGDGDGFGTSDTTLETCPSEKPTSYVANPGDCDDDDDRVNPDYDGDFQTQPSAGGTFDYDCSGEEEKEFGSVGDCKALCRVEPGWEENVAECGVKAPYINDCGGFGCQAETSDKTQGCK